MLRVELGSIVPLDVIDGQVLFDVAATAASPARKAAAPPFAGWRMAARRGRAWAA